MFQDNPAFSKFANKADTLRHLELQYLRWGRTSLMIWSTDSGKWIDDSMLHELVRENKVKYVPPVTRSMWLQGKWEYIPTGMEKPE